MKKIQRAYDCCGKVAFTFSRASQCCACKATSQFDAGRKELKAKLEELYEDVQEGERTHYGRLTWTFTHTECGTTQTWTTTNLQKRFKEDPAIAPCSRCGAKRRMLKAQAASVLANGVPDHLLTEWEAYRRKVRRLSERTYRLHKNEINPNNLERRLGNAGYHLDHKVSIHFGFTNGIAAEEIAAKSNLQMLTGFENVSKGRR